MVHDGAMCFADAQHEQIILPFLLTSSALWVQLCRAQKKQFLREEEEEIFSPRVFVQLFFLEKSRAKELLPKGTHGGESPDTVMETSSLPRDLSVTVCTLPAARC